MDSIQPELKSFIENFILENKIKNVDLSDFNLHTSLDLDLNLLDLDIDLFLSDFVRTFNIDYKRFDWNKHGYPEGSYIILLIRSFLNYKSDWVKRLSHWLYKPKITVYTLKEAIETGVLV